MAHDIRAIRGASGVRMKLAIAIAAALLSACGGGNGSTAAPIVPPLRAQGVALIGDSITEAWSPAFMQGFAPLNLGVAGKTTGYMLSTELPLVLESHTEIGVLVIDGGINDLRVTQSTDAEIMDNIKTMGRIATEHGIRVIVASLMLADYQGAGDYAPTPTARIEELDQQILELCAQEGYEYADYKDVMLLPDGTEDFALYQDGLHPLGAGYVRMWNVLKPLLLDDGITL